MKFFGGLTKRRLAGPASNRVGELIATADAARDRKDWHEAAAAYRRVVDVDPGLKHIWVQLGNTEKESGKLAAAEAAYEDLPKSMR
jgi:hypothetical protein